MRLENHAETLRKYVSYSAEVGIEFAITVKGNSALIRHDNTVLSIQFLPDTRNRHAGLLGCFDSSENMLKMWEVTETYPRKDFMHDEIPMEWGIENAILMCEDYVKGRV